MKALVYDTETTGLPLFNEASNDPRQPHIVQLAALLVDLASGKTLSSIDFTVKHDGWESCAQALAAHGITTEIANDIGVPELVALEGFTALWLNSDLRIAHNEQFDARIIRCALHRFDPGMSPEKWRDGTAECTQQLATPIMKLPPTERMRLAGRTHHKSANLREAYLHFTGRELVDAHTAMADAQGCREVYFAIKRLTTARPAAVAGVHN